MKTLFSITECNCLNDDLFIHLPWNYPIICLCMHVFPSLINPFISLYLYPCICTHTHSYIHVSIHSNFHPSINSLIHTCINIHASRKITILSPMHLYHYSYKNIIRSTIHSSVYTYIQTSTNAVSFTHELP